MKQNSGIILYFDIIKFSEYLLHIKNKDLFLFSEALNNFLASLENNRISTRFLSNSLLIFINSRKLSKAEAQSIIYDLIKDVFAFFYNHKILICGSLSKGLVIYEKNILIGKPVENAIDNVKYYCKCPVFLIPKNVLDYNLGSGHIRFSLETLKSIKYKQIKKEFFIVKNDDDWAIKSIIEEKVNKYNKENNSRKTKFWQDLKINYCNLGDQ